jgi:hypothetical protein
VVVLWCAISLQGTWLCFSISLCSYVQYSSDGSVCCLFLNSEGGDSGYMVVNGFVFVGKEMSVLSVVS